MPIARILLGLTLAFTANMAVAQQEAKSIFNGSDLSGWKGNSELWSVEDGVITGRTTAENPLKFNTFLIWDDGTVGNFELEFDYRIQAEDEANPGGNSGVQYRSKVLDAETFVVGGYQADIDLTMKFAGINYEEKGRGILAQRGQRVTINKTGKKTKEQFGEPEELGKVIKSGDWNHYKIVARGAKLSHFINDELMSEVIDREAEKASAEGVLALQIHQGPPMLIQFKNLMLKELVVNKKKPASQQ